MTAPKHPPFQFLSERTQARFPFKALVILCIATCCGAIYSWVIVTTPNRNLPGWFEDGFAWMLLASPLFILGFAVVEVRAILHLFSVANDRTKMSIALATLGLVCLGAGAVGCFLGFLSALCGDCAR